MRTSSDLSSVDSSPRLIAASYVLHRLLVPRHPPYALHYLQQRCSRPLCSPQTTHKQPPHADTNTNHQPRKADNLCGMTAAVICRYFLERKHSRVLSGPKIGRASCRERVCQSV